MQLCTKDCENYYKAQVGGGLNYFSGTQYQRGTGLFGDIRRFITPLLIKGGKYIGKKLLNTGSNVFKDVTAGKTFKESTQKRFKDLTKEVKDDLFRKFQKGAGIKRKGKQKTKHITKRKRISKRQRDIFS